MTAFSKFANKTATVVAPAEIVNGKRSNSLVVKSMINIMPLFPASRETVMRLELQSPLKIFETYTESASEIDLYEGYSMLIDGELFLVKYISRWSPIYKKILYQIVLEDLKINPEPDLVMELLSQTVSNDVSFTENFNTTVIIPEGETVVIDQGVTMQILGN
jgi:hypothetical protein